MKWNLRQFYFQLRCSVCGWVVTDICFVSRAQAHAEQAHKARIGIFETETAVL